MDIFSARFIPNDCITSVFYSKRKQLFLVTSVYLQKHLYEPIISGESTLSSLKIIKSWLKNETIFTELCSTLKHEEDQSPRNTLTILVKIILIFILDLLDSEEYIFPQDINETILNDGYLSQLLGNSEVLTSEEVQFTVTILDKSCQHYFSKECLLGILIMKKYYNFHIILEDIDIPLEEEMENKYSEENKFTVSFEDRCYNFDSLEFIRGIKTVGLWFRKKIPWISLVDEEGDDLDYK